MTNVATGKSPAKRWRFKSGNTLTRHLIILGAAAALIYLFAMVHAQWSPMHRWNRAFADASLMLLVLAMALGPATRLWPRLKPLVPYRRETGIYAAVLAIVHTVIILDGWVQWDFARLFGFEFHPVFEQYVMLQHGFGLANLLGVVALVYAILLLSTSNDRSVRALGAPVWKFLQNGAVVLWALVVLHTAYFLFLHFLSFHRPTPGPNPLQWPFIGAVASVFVLRAAAFVATWRRRRGPGGTATGSMAVS